MKELLPIVLAAAMWGRHWKGCNISFHCDNEAIVSVIQKQYAKHHLLTHLLRCLFSYALYLISITLQLIFQGHSTLRQMQSYAITFPFSPLSFTGQQSVILQALLEFLVINTPDWGSASSTALFVHSLPKEFPPQPQPSTSQGSTGI